MVTLAQATEALGSGTGQQILAVVVGLLLTALVWIVRLHMTERAAWESKFEGLHEKTLAIALKVQQTIIKLGESPEDD
tara:strand:+ start:383 stop:616 length:234 start_codon:yes stop_codon:yes gene_type:complete